MDPANLLRRSLEWFRESDRRRLAARRIAICIGLAIVAIDWSHTALRHRGFDFDQHWEFGRRLRAGEFIYAYGTDLPYPPFWAVAHSPLARMPMRVAAVVFWPTFLLALGGLVWVLRRLTHESLPLGREASFWCTVAVLALASRFLMRDMAECGVNLALVALTWLAVYAWIKRCDAWGGLALGAAIALKCTAVAFLAYFIWKRQWKMALTTTVAAVALSISPAWWMGQELFQTSIAHWFHHAKVGVTEPNPLIGVLGLEGVQNHSLRPTLARFLTLRPVDSDGTPIPSALPLVNLPPATAGWLIRGGLLTLALAVAWRFRAAVQRRDDVAIVWECAVISLAMLLYSPITWGQHCVGALPALYLLVRTQMTQGWLPVKVQWAVAGYVVFILLLNRGLVGRPATINMLAFGTTTWCLLGLLLAAVAMRGRAAARDGVESQADEPWEDDAPAWRRAA